MPATENLLCHPGWSWLQPCSVSSCRIVQMHWTFKSRSRKTLQCRAGRTWVMRRREMVIRKMRAVNGRLMEEKEQKMSTPLRDKMTSLNYTKVGSQTSTWVLGSSGANRELFTTPGLSGTKNNLLTLEQTQTRYEEAVFSAIQSGDHKHVPNRRQLDTR